jgi:hypothetical protein
VVPDFDPPSSAAPIWLNDLRSIIGIMLPNLDASASYPFPDELAVASLAMETLIQRLLFVFVERSEGRLRQTLGNGPAVLLPHRRVMLRAEGAPKAAPLIPHPQRQPTQRQPGVVAAQRAPQQGPSHGLN